MKIKVPFIKKHLHIGVGGQKAFTGSIPLQQGSFMEWVFAGNGRVTPLQAMQFYRTNASVATAVDKIADAMSQIRPVLATKVKTSKGTEIVFDPDHDIIKTLMNPNPFETYDEFIGKLIRHYLLTHTGYFQMLGVETRPPHELYAPKPQNMSVMQGDDNFPQSFLMTGQEMGAGNYLRVFDKRKGIVKYLDGGLKEIYQIMGFSSRSDDMQADSPLEAIAQDIRQQVYGKTHNLSMLKNGGRLSLVFSFKDDHPNDDEHKARKKRINEDFAGSLNAGKIGVITAPDVKVEEFGTSNKDMDYVNLDATASKSIFQRYDIPLPLVTTDASTYNNVTEAVFYLVENPVLMNYKTIFSGISKPLLPRFGLDPAVNVLTYDPESIPVLIRQKLKEIEQRKKINIETPDELRALIPNRGDLPDGVGKVVYQNSSLVPMGTDLDDNGDFETDEELAERIRREQENENN